MANIKIYMAAREYYCGYDEIELPYGLGEDDIKDVYPDGYGEFMMYIAPESYKKLEELTQHLEFEEPSWSESYWYAVDGDWEVQLLGRGTEYALRYRGTLEMEFADVDENMIDDWSITDGET